MSRGGMNAPAEKPAEPIRALTLFESLPPQHVTFRVDDDGSDPHLRSGEYAVVDTTDRELQPGELYLRQSDGGSRDRSIVQVKIATGVEVQDDPSETVWTTLQLRGFRKVGELSDFGIPLFGGLSGGWYSAEELRAVLVGRVVGVSMNSLGNLLGPSAGYENEAECNAAFDAGEYLDVLIAVGYRPYVMRRRDGGLRYIEEFPRGARSEAQEAALFAVQVKCTAASQAIQHVKSECVRRGLVC